MPGPVQHLLNSLRPSSGKGATQRFSGPVERLAYAATASILPAPEGYEFQYPLAKPDEIVQLKGVIVDFAKEISEASRRGQDPALGRVRPRS